jgi:alkylation response protein AidB-like acyl-CoA dehydrogenase
MSTMATTFTDDLAAAAREVFERELPRDGTRQRLNTETFSSRLWNTAAQLGWFRVLTSEHSGGSDGGPAELAALMIESGRYLASGPWFETVAAAGRLRSHTDLGPDESVITLAGLDSSLTLAKSRLTGRTGFAEHADRSDRVIVLATEGSEPVVLVADLRSPGVAVRPIQRFDLASRPCAVDFDSVEIKSIVLRGDEAHALRTTLRSDALLATTGRLIGVMEEVRDMTVQYAKDRFQFDRPIGSFQAVQQRLSDLAVLVAASRSACSAAVGLATEGKLTELGALKGLVSANARKVVESSLQVHGGIGFTDEHRLHLYYKHALRLQAAWGSETEHAIAIGVQLLTKRKPS